MSIKFSGFFSRKTWAVPLGGVNSGLSSVKMINSVGCYCGKISKGSVFPVDT